MHLLPSVNISLERCIRIIENVLLFINMISDFKSSIVILFSLISNSLLLFEVMIYQDDLLL